MIIIIIIETDIEIVQGNVLLCNSLTTTTAELPSMAAANFANIRIFIKYFNIVCGIRIQCFAFTSVCYISILHYLYYTGRNENN